MPSLDSLTDRHAWIAVRRHRSGRREGGRCACHARGFSRSSDLVAAVTSAESRSDLTHPIDLAGPCAHRAGHCAPAAQGDRARSVPSRRPPRPMTLSPACRSMGLTTRAGRRFGSCAGASPASDSAWARDPVMSHSLAAGGRDAIWPSARRSTRSAAWRRPAARYRTIPPLCGC